MLLTLMTVCGTKIVMMRELDETRVHPVFLFLLSLMQLRLIAICRSDARLCKENIYPYLTKDWCLDNGYRFDNDSRFCKMRLD